MVRMSCTTSRSIRPKPMQTDPLSGKRLVWLIVEMHKSLVVMDKGTIKLILIFFRR